MFYEVDSSEIEESKSTEPAPPAEPWSYSWQGFVGQLKKTSEQFVQVIKEDIQELAVMGEGLVRQMDDSITSAASEQSTTQTAEHSSTSDQTAEQSNAQTEQVEESGSTINKLFGSASSYVTKAEELTTKGFSSAVQYASKAEQLLDNQLSQITNEIKNNLFEKEEIRPVGNRTENSIYDLAKHENTYLKPFDVDQAQMERYFAFRGSFDQIAHAGRIAGLLDQQPKVLYFFQKLGMLLLDLQIRYLIRMPNSN
jgi:gas vesicle protein